MTAFVLHDFSWQRMINAVEAVDRRQVHCVKSFHRAEIDYAIIGGRAAMAWVDSVDCGASRTTPNIDVLVERADLDRIIETICYDGWTHQLINGWHTFAESSTVSFHSRIRLVFANELFRPNDLLPTPSLSESRWLNEMRVVDLEALIRMKLTAFRTIDRVHLDDLLSVELYDPTWISRFPGEFATRLQHVFDEFEVWPEVLEQAMLNAGFKSDEELVEFQRHSRQHADGRLAELPWFLARANAHQKYRRG